MNSRYADIDIMISPSSLICFVLDDGFSSWWPQGGGVRVQSWAMAASHGGSPGVQPLSAGWQFLCSLPGFHAPHLLHLGWEILGIRRCDPIKRWKQNLRFVGSGEKIRVCCLLFVVLFKLSMKLPHLRTFWMAQSHGPNHSRSHWNLRHIPWSQVRPRRQIYLQRPGWDWIFLGSLWFFKIHLVGIS